MPEMHLYHQPDSWRYTRECHYWFHSHLPNLNLFFALKPPGIATAEQTCWAPLGRILNSSEQRPATSDTSWQSYGCCGRTWGAGQLLAPQQIEGWRRWAKGCTTVFHDSGAQTPPASEKGFRCPQTAPSASLRALVLNCSLPCFIPEENHCQFASVDLKLNFLCKNQATTSLKNNKPSTSSALG